MTAGSPETPCSSHDSALRSQTRCWSRLPRRVLFPGAGRRGEVITAGILPVLAARVTVKVKVNSQVDRARSTTGTPAGPGRHEKAAGECAADAGTLGA